MMLIRVRISPDRLECLDRCISWQVVAVIGSFSWWWIGLLINVSDVYIEQLL